MVSPLMVASSWEIGPIIDGRNYSIGMPLHPTQTTDGWAFDFPLSSGKVGYVTYRFGSLSGKSHIVLKYRIETDPGVKIYPVCCAQLDSMGPTMYIQEKNDNWTTSTKRWWATFNSPYPIQAGEYELDIPLNNGAGWTDVTGHDSIHYSNDFADSKADAERVGFTFGGGDGYGHGVYADGRARFVVTSFKVE